MAINEFRGSFDRDGFVVVRGFLPPDELAELQAQLDRYIRDVVPRLDASEAFYQEKGRPETLKQLQRMSREPFFEKYRANHRWRAFAESMLGEPTTSAEPEWFNKPPGSEHPTPPHQDNHYFQLVPPQVMTMWLALDTVDEENGALRYVRGSHRLGRRPHGVTEILGFSQGVQDYGDDDRQAESLVCLEPGDMVAHHGETIHRADANRSANRHRRAFAMVFRGVSCGVDEQARVAYQEKVREQHQRHGIASATS